jgi:hypothetical protein
MTDKLVEAMLAPELEPESGEETPRRGKSRARKAFYIKHAELYINTFNHTIDTMKKAGIECEATRNLTDDYVEYIVKIPLKQSKQEPQIGS